MPVVSIIMPIYKVEKYLKQAIDSVLSQTMSDFELIVVDDGSPDNCGKICDEYADKDKRVRVLHQNNQGVSAARNAALEMATGTYVGFVDADDWIEPIMLEYMYNAALDNEADMVICDYREEKETVKIFSQIQGYAKSIINYSGIEAVKKALLLPSFCCIRIIKRSCINDIRFQRDIIHAEDLLFLISVLQNINKITYLDQKLYAYRIRLDSAVRRPFYDEFLDTIIISEYCAFVFMKREIDLKPICYFRIFRSLYQAIGKLEHESRQTQKKFNRQILFLHERTRLYCIDFLLNPYISCKNKCLFGIFTISPNFYFYIKPILKSVFRRKP